MGWGTGGFSEGRGGDDDGAMDDGVESDFDTS